VRHALLISVYKNFVNTRGVARDKSMCRHHCSRGSGGHATSENIDILYRRSCIMGHFKACFEGNNLIFCIVCQAEKYILLLGNANSPQRNLGQR